MQILKTYRTALILLATAVIVSALFRRLAPLLIYTAGLIVAYLPGSGALNRSPVFRMFVGIIALLCLFQMEAMFFWFTGIWAFPLLYTLVSLLIVAVGLWFVREKKGWTTAPMRLGRLDLLFVLPALIIGGLYAARTLVPAESNATSIVRSIMYGMDDATHANIFADVLRHDSNILAGDENSKLMNKSAHASYPMGWHISTSVVAAGFAGNHDRTPLESIQVYFYAKLATLFAAIVAITLFVYTLSSRIWQRLHSTIHIAAASVIALFVSGMLLLPLFFDGFFSFMPIILYTTLFATLIIDSRREPADAVPLTLLAAASSLTWMLTGPIMLVAIAVYYLAGSNWSVRKLPRRVYISLAVGSIFLLAQAYILYTANRNALLNIANPGGIVNPDHLLLLVALGAFVFVLRTKGTAFMDTVRPLLGLIGTAIAVLCLLLLYLTTQTSEITYYYYKLQMPVLVILTVLLGVYAFRLIFNSSQGKTFLEQAALLVLAVACLGVSIPGLIGYQYAYDIVTRARSYGMTSGDAGILIERSLDRPVSNSNERVYFMAPDQNARNILASNIDKLAYRSTTCDYDMFAAAYNYNVKEMAGTIQDCAPTTPKVVIYTDKKGEKELKKQLDPALLRQDEVTLVVI